MSKNLWPDFDSAKLPRSPKSVIDEAGSGLEQKTDGAVRFWSGSTRILREKVVVECSLFTPALMYHFPFLVVEFGVQDIYPVTIAADKVGDGVAHDEKELTTLLAKIFNAPSTVATIERLMALAKG
jgi:hypothetical protein